MKLEASRHVWGVPLSALLVGMASIAALSGIAFAAVQEAGDAVATPISAVVLTDQESPSPATTAPSEEPSSPALEDDDHAESDEDSDDDSSQDLQDSDDLEDHSGESDSDDD